MQGWCRGTAKKDGRGNRFGLTGVSFLCDPHYVSYLNPSGSPHA
jgi:hypothetical protein